MNWIQKFAYWILSEELEKQNNVLSDFKQKGLL